jgi:hypothetical protein
VCDRPQDLRSVFDARKARPQRSESNASDFLQPLLSVQQRTERVARIAAS